ncbi:hypothetical protein DJ531_06480 [Sulfolobus sp. A20-N-F6]|uniref:hypothetical protein n=1 Tax=Sulfolobaceae TaxID=118883 RepID=UPI0011814500|nr:MULTISPECIES: hypothetical protein [unclassified Sulfolobus]TRM78357.1 hypothetical protein DJ528_04905 [Sulfolobus sp. B5]TRM83184.1 hypothetical protein DJ531_06480 [Sulfolobus sp. A20-N-F6]TRM84933.1 hypothetical protein DJ522_02785 [Sulfolobus sp. F3]
MGDDWETLGVLDEIFQVCYFLQIYAGLNKFCINDVVKFSGMETEIINDCLDRLCKYGYLIKEDNGYYILSSIGLNEAKSRYEEEFKFFHGSAHGLCNDPKCACHEKGPLYCNLTINESFKFKIDTKRPLRINSLHELS